MNLELADIQGIILKGYGRLHAARFLLLGVRNPAAAKQWLGALAGSLRSAVDERPPSAVNVALTFGGFAALNLDQKSLKTFPVEFQEGMTSDHRQRILGDSGSSSPEKWQWGGLRNSPVHILLMLYAPDEASLNALYKAQAQGFAAGLAEIQRLETVRVPFRKEHFGFRDGISEPVVQGSGRTGTPENTIAPGEFVLGYLNEYGKLTDSPKSSQGDLGRNGSYLVFRQLEQDVRGFWQYMNQVAAGNPMARLRVASKMVGRWPSGAPLVLSPVTDSNTLEGPQSFAYSEQDPSGDRCPVAAHIRRANPRDTQVQKREDAVKLTRRHRLIRRGRSYGAPLAPSMNPEDILKATADGERGLHFIAFNANIARQFEFIQQTWLNSPKFNGLADSPDPLIGPEGSFVIPADPVRCRLQDVPRFLQVRGGAYFFMPSISAVRALAALP